MGMTILTTYWQTAVISQYSLFLIIALLHMPPLMTILALSTVRTRSNYFGIS